ncbi:MAG: ribonuclease HII [Spirochaetaceae bacterium]|jgi:ribonuclease HII|nr:ribonuclease HII [Spirochaetaceae bacterium]
MKPPVVVGLDEAGRGPLAGPVSAAAVILPRDFPLDILGDSKKLSPGQRNKAAALITEKAAWGIGWAEASEIDRINILRASLLAMTRAWEALDAAFPDYGIARSPAVVLSAVADGLYCPELPIPCRALVKADAAVPEVMAASILAKTARDRMMVRYSWFYPEYGYDRHKGYPTADHRQAVLRWGPSPIQRKTFTVRPLTAPAR